MRKEVLITGVAGLIGANFADWILKNRPEIGVVGVDDLSGGYESNIDKRVKFYKRNLIHDSVSDIFEKHNIAYVFHFAAYAAEGLSPFMRKYNYLNNTVATANIIDSCINHKAERLVFTSTMAVYGHAGMESRSDEPISPFSEHQVPEPIDPYGIAKYACEMDIKVANKQHGLDYCIIRPHNVYGKKQNIWDRYRNVLGIWMYQHLHGQPFSIFGDGEQKRAFSCVDDSLPCLWTSAVSPGCSGEIINLGGTKEYTINHASQILLKIIEGGEVRYHEERHEVKNAWASYEKSINLLNYKNRTSLEAGLKDMWEWAQVQPDRPRQSWDKYEVEEKIYEFWKNK